MPEENISRWNRDSEGIDTLSQQIYLRKVEIFFHNDNEQDRTWPRDMFPYSSDQVKLQAIVWATLDGGNETGEPYAFWPGADPENPYEYFRNDGLYCCPCRGVAGNGRVNMEQARPDMNPFGSVPNLESWRIQRLPEDVEVAVWPSDWPHPEFAWFKLAYKTTLTGANDPRPYYYDEPEDITPDQDSHGWTVTWPNGLAAGTHRFAVRVTLDDQEVSCPVNNTERNAGCSLHLCIREANIQEPEAALQQCAHNELPHPLPDPDPNVVEFLRWTSIFLGVPYEVGGKWFGGKSPGARSTQVNAGQGYQGYGLDCTGLPSAAGILVNMGWGTTYPQWRRSTHRQGNPVPSYPLWDQWNNWVWRSGRRRWVREGGNFENWFSRRVLGFVQPGDLIDTGNPEGDFNHIRIVYRVVSRDTEDAEVEIIEASSSEEGKVRIEQRSLSDVLSGRQKYGLWRPHIGEDCPFPEPTSSEPEEIESPTPETSGS
ncbi:MAG: hypothetical protein QME90_06605 [Thermodesulfobacteriota bacterium]|nr:hypothetical protein [Thermodesulfobacteriota bacterium]